MTTLFLQISSPTAFYQAKSSMTLYKRTLCLIKAATLYKCTLVQCHGTFCLIKAGGQKFAKECLCYFIIFLLPYGGNISTIYMYCCCVTTLEVVAWQARVIDTMWYHGFEEKKNDTYAFLDQSHCYCQH